MNKIWSCNLLAMYKVARLKTANTLSLKLLRVYVRVYLTYLASWESTREPTAEIGSLIRPDGTFTISRKETLELLIENHFLGILTLDSRRAPFFESIRLPMKNYWEVAKKLNVQLNNFSPSNLPVRMVCFQFCFNLDWKYSTYSY